MSPAQWPRSLRRHCRSVARGVCPPDGHRHAAALRHEAQLLSLFHVYQISAGIRAQRHLSGQMVKKSCARPSQPAGLTRAPWFATPRSHRTDLCQDRNRSDGVDGVGAIRPRSLLSRPARRGAAPPSRERPTLAAITGRAGLAAARRLLTKILDTRIPLFLPCHPPVGDGGGGGGGCCCIAVCQR